MVYTLAVLQHFNFVPLQTHSQKLFINKITHFFDYSEALLTYQVLVFSPVKTRNPSENTDSESFPYGFSLQLDKNNSPIKSISYLECTTDVPENTQA